MVLGLIEPYLFIYLVNVYPTLHHKNVSPAGHITNKAKITIYNLQKLHLSHFKGLCMYSTINTLKSEAVIKY